jgi:hypothetical protein
MVTRWMTDCSGQPQGLVKLSLRPARGSRPPWRLSRRLSARHHLRASSRRLLQQRGESVS